MWILGSEPQSSCYCSKCSIWWTLSPAFPSFLTKLVWMSLKANKCTSLSSLKGCILFCGADNPSFTQGFTHWEDTSSWGIVESTRLEVTQPTPAAAAVLVVIIQIYIYFSPFFPKAMISSPYSGRGTGGQNQGPAALRHDNISFSFWLFRSHSCFTFLESLSR